MSTKSLLNVPVIILLCLSIVNSSYANDWHYEGDKKNIALWFRDYPNSPIPEFKATTIINNTSMATVLAVLLDIEACPEWIHQCESALLLEQPSNVEKIVYQVNKIAFARDRDLIFHAALSYENDGKTIKINLRGDKDFCLDNHSAECSLINKSEHLRIPTLAGEYILEQQNQNSIEVTWQQFINPGGKLPTWVIKNQLDKIAYQTLAGLRKQVQKGKYKNKKIVIENDQLELVDVE